MSKDSKREKKNIFEMIAEMCSDGVKYKRLGDCCKIETGKLNANAAVEDGKYPFFTTAQEVSHIDSYRWDTEALMIAGNANVGDVKYYKGKFEAYQRTYVLTNFSQGLLPKFLFYVLKSQLKPYLEDHKHEAAMTYIVLSSLQNFKIPVPPLAVQREVVRVLDTMTELTTELTTNLTAEMTARRKQYESYRDLLLACDNQPLALLEDVCFYPSERIDSSSVDCNNYISVENLLQNKEGKRASESIPEDVRLIAYKTDDILIGNIRPYLRKIWMADNDGGTNGDVLVIRVKDNNILLPEYAYFLLSSEDFFIYDNKHAKGAKMPRGNKKDIMHYAFHLPTIEYQQYAVSILQQLRQLSYDLTTGLPAEIAAREKQYAYYRDLLLSFQPAQHSLF